MMYCTPKISIFAFHAHSKAVFLQSSAVSALGRAQAGVGTVESRTWRKAKQGPVCYVSTVGLARNRARKPRAFKNHQQSLGWPCLRRASLVSDCVATCWSQMRSKALALVALVAALVLGGAGSAAADAAAGASLGKPPQCAQVPDASFQAAATNFCALCPEPKEDSCPDDCVSALTTVSATAMPLQQGSYVPHA